MKISEVLSLSFVCAETFVCVRNDFVVLCLGGPDFTMDFLNSAIEIESFTFEPAENKLFIDVKECLE